jgi:hypothetical protein
VNDTYIIAFMPFGLLAFAMDDRADPARPAALSWSLAVSGVFILAFSLFIRGVDAGIEVQWKAADRLLASGIPDTNIFAPYPWQMYHGAFDQWIDAGAPGLAATRPYPLTDRMHEPFSDWLRKRNRKSVYLIYDGTRRDSLAANWQPLAFDPYRDPIFRSRGAWTIKITGIDSTASAPAAITSK